MTVSEKKKGLVESRGVGHSIPNKPGGSKCHRGPRETNLPWEMGVENIFFQNNMGGVEGGGKEKPIFRKIKKGEPDGAQVKVFYSKLIHVAVFGSSGLKD